MINGSEVTEPMNVISVSDFPTTEIRYFVEAPIVQPFEQEPENDFVDSTSTKRVLAITVLMIVFIVGTALLSDLW